MSLRRIASALSVCVVASAGIVVAAPAKPAKPAKPAVKPAAGPGSGSADQGTAVQMTEDTPPADPTGMDENPNTPNVVGMEPHVVAKPKPKGPTGYPIEEALRPITLPKNMSEVSIDPHAQVSPYINAQTLRARYGLTDKIQIGLSYMLGGLYDNPATMKTDYGVHVGKTVGLDVTYLLRKWVGVRVGIPVYVATPVGVSAMIGVPLKFTFGNKFAIGGLDDLLNIKIANFAPSFYQAEYNAEAAYSYNQSGTEQSAGHLRIAAYGIMQYRPNIAIIGRFGVDDDFGSGGGSAAGTTMNNGGTTTFIRAGVEYTPRKYLDVGASLGFDDLGHAGTFGPALYAAFRI